MTDGLPTVQRLECLYSASLISMGSRRERLCGNFKKRKNKSGEVTICVDGPVQVAMLVSTKGNRPMTYLTARAAYEAGHKELAWVIAQQDEGMLEGVTKDQFFAHVESCIAQSAITEGAYV